ncbi:MAG: hypothetical protein V7776_13730 [Halopseudomonas aestusnigri]
MNYRNSRWFLALISIIIAFLLSPDLWIALVQGYEGDSFYTLGFLERAGLITLTIALSGLLLFIGTCKSHFLYNLKSTIPFQKLSVPLIDLLGAFGLFYVFIWFSPQVYYSYYLFVFNDLSWQIVIKDGPSLSEIVNLLLLEDQQTLSQHGQGLLGRALLLHVALYRFVIFVNFENAK